MKCEACGHINERRKKNATYLTDAEFSQWWSMYPRKTSKFLCQKIWKKIEFAPGLFERMVVGLGRQRQTDQWKQGIIPNPSTWLHQRRWDDEVIANGKIVPRIEPQSVESLSKEKAAKDRLEAIKEREFEKREAARLAQERDDLRSRKMMEAAGEKDDREMGYKTVTPGIPVEITKCIDENGNKFIEEQERIYVDGE